MLGSEEETGPESVASGHSNGSGGREKKFNVTIIYNGLERSLEVNPNQAVQALLAHALSLFGVQGTPGLVLLLEGGTPLNLDSSVEDAGVVPGSRLLLRPAQMQSGVTCG